MVFCSTMELRPESLIPSSHAVVFSGATLLFQKIKEEKKKFGFLKKSCACFKHSNLFKVKGLGTPESAPPPLSQTPQQTSFSTPILHTHRIRHPSIPPWSGIKTDGWKESGEEIQEEEEEEVEEEEEEGFFLGVTSRGLPEFGRKREKEGEKKKRVGKKKEDFFSPP